MTKFGILQLMENLLSLVGEDWYEYEILPYKGGKGVIKFTEDLTEIPNYGFGCVENLEIIVIPNSVTSIGEYAFQSFSDLTDILYTGTVSQWNAITKGSNWHQGVPTTTKVHCTDGDVSI